MQITLILHNIRSVHNVGSIFRTADAAGVEKIILSGYTPTPLDRFGRERKDLSKVALGAEKNMPWAHVMKLAPMLKKLKEKGYYVLALEQDPRSVSVFKWQTTAQRSEAKKKLALIVGNEVRGISKPLLKHVNTILEIPMQRLMVRQAHHPRNRGRGKESLNVSVATGIALFELMHASRRG